MNAAAYTTILYDIFFFMVQQKVLELSNLRLVLTFRRWRWVLGPLVAAFSLAITLLVVHFAVRLYKMIGESIYSQLLLVYIGARFAFYALSLWTYVDFFGPKLNALVWISILEEPLRTEALKLVNTEGDCHLELMERIPSHNLQDYLSKLELSPSPRQQSQERHKSPRSLLNQNLLDSPTRLTRDTPRTKFMREKVCIVCLGEFQSEQEISVLSCNGKKKASSLYHRQCLSNWLANKQECPLCRDPQFIETHCPEKKKSKSVKRFFSFQSTSTSSSYNMRLDMLRHDYFMY